MAATLAHGARHARGRRGLEGQQQQQQAPPLGLASPHVISWFHPSLGCAQAQVCSKVASSAWHGLAWTWRHRWRAMAANRIWVWTEEPACLAPS